LAREQALESAQRVPQRRGRKESSLGLKDVTPTPPGSLHWFEKKGLAIGHLQLHGNEQDGKL
jgi:hypothetical protein